MRIADYRARAAELRDEADRAVRADVKAQLLLMAADWDMLADNAEELGRSPQGGWDGDWEAASGF